MDWLDNLKLTRKFMLIPVISLVCLTLLFVLFSSVNLEITSSITEIKEQKENKINRMTILFSDLLSRHTKIVNLLVNSSNGGDPSEVYEQGEKLLDQLSKIKQLYIKHSKDNVNGEQENKEFSLLLNALGDYSNASTTSIEMATVDKSNSISSLNRANQFFNTFYQSQLNYVSGLNRQADSYLIDLQNNTDSRYNIFITIIGISMIIIFLISILLTNSIKSSIQLAISAVNVMANRDFRDHQYSNRKDEVGSILRAVEKCQSNNKELILEISDTRDHLVQSSQDVQRLIIENSGRSEQQDNGIKQTLQISNHLVQSISDVASNAGNTATATRQANELAKTGKKMVLENLGSIRNLSEELVQAESSLLRLSENSKNIANVVNTVRGITDQTNLLALNAAIEAARAGEQGRGFAVVADEVRTLAQRTQQSTLEIDEMISQVQAAIDETVETMKKGREMSMKNVIDAEKAGDTLDSISNTVSVITDQNENFALLASNQTNDVGDLDKQLGEINTLVTESYKQAQKTTNKTESMITLAEKLQVISNQFKI